MSDQIRLMREEDIPACIEMTLESFGNEYLTEQFNTIEEEFKMMFEPDWWGRPKYFIYERDGKIIGMGGYSLSALDWGIYDFFWLSVRNGYENQGIAKSLVKWREVDVSNMSCFKDDITILFSCTKNVIGYHEKNGYKVILEKASGREVIMGRSFKNV